MTDFSQLSDEDLLALYQQSDPAQAAGAKAGAVKRAQLGATRDFDRLEEARRGAQQGFDFTSQAQQLDKLLSETPTGPMADATKFIGRYTPFLKDEQRDLRSFDRIASQITLGNAQNLKGALSDKDIAFLQRAAPTASETPGYNQDTIDELERIGSRLTNYEAGLQSWTDTLGSPGAKNARGQTYDQWFGQWASTSLAPEKFAGSATRPVKKPAVAPQKAAATDTRPRVAQAAPAVAAPAVTPAAKAPPKPGTIRNGYRFRGGDPSQQSNWEKL